MADITIPELAPSTTPDLDSAIEISEQTDPLNPITQNMTLRQFLNRYSAEMTGYWNYHDSATSGSPIAGTSASPIILTNNGLGANTRKKPPTGFGDIWNAGTDKFDFTDLNEDDLFRIRLNYSITTTVANQYFKTYLELSQSPGTPFNMVYQDAQVKDVDTYQEDVTHNFYGRPSVINNSAQFKVSSDANFSVIVTGFFIEVLRRSI